MDPNNSQPTGENPNLNKLEEDLDRLTKEAAATSQPAPVPPLQSQPLPQPQPTEVPSAPIENVVPTVQPIETPPAPPNVPIQDGKKGVSLMSVAIILLVVAMLVAVGYVVYTRIYTKTAAPSVPAVVVPVQTPTAVPIPEATLQASTSATPDPTVNWKTYESQTFGFNFKYPENYVLKEMGAKDYLTLITNLNNQDKDQIDIDVQSVTNNVLYEKVLTSEKEVLTNVNTQTDGNWIRITGDGTGYSQGEKFTTAVTKLDNNAIKVVTTSTDSAVINNFNQILSTFKFVTATPSATPQ